MHDNSHFKSALKLISLDGKWTGSDQLRLRVSSSWKLCYHTQKGLRATKYLIASFLNFRKAGHKLPPLGEFAVGMVFVHEKESVQEVVSRFENYANSCEMRVLFWRVADVNNSQIGTVAASAEPVTLQVLFNSCNSVQKFLKLKKHDSLPSPFL